jgi:hypothetical protein
VATRKKVPRPRRPGDWLYTHHSDSLLRGNDIDREEGFDTVEIPGYLA